MINEDEDRGMVIQMVDCGIWMFFYEWFSFQL